MITSRLLKACYETSPSFTLCQNSSNFVRPILSDGCTSYKSEPKNAGYFRAEGRRKRFCGGAEEEVNPAAASQKRIGLSR
jgi:hypothetical protein